MTGPIRKEVTIGDCRLILGDCLEVMPLLGKVDALICDPPYGIAHSSNHGASWAGRQIASDQDTRARDAVAAMFDGPWVFFGTWKTPPVSGARGCIVWDKGPAFGMGDLSFPWKPSFELAYIGGTGWTGVRDEGVLRGPIVVSWESRGRRHPHQKPVWLATHFIEKLPNARTIVDPFAGSGTTLVACAKLGRRGIGIEIDPDYFEIACERVRKAYDQPDMFIAPPAPKPVQEDMGL